MELLIAIAILAVLTVVININDTTRLFALYWGMKAWEARWTIVRWSVYAGAFIIGWNLPHWIGAW